jgi:hypothetical protein
VPGQGVVAGMAAGFDVVALMAATLQGGAATPAARQRESDVSAYGLESTRR